MSPAFKLIILIAAFFMAIAGIWFAGFSIPMAMIFTICLLMGLIIVLFILLFFAGAFQFSGKGWFWKLSRIKRKTGALDYIWTGKLYGTGGIRIDLDKVGEDRVINFGNEPDSNQAILGDQCHWEVDSKIPFYFLREGIPHSIDLNQEYTPSQAARLVNQTVLLSHTKGKLEALGILEDLGKKDMILYGLIVIAVLGVFVLGFLSFQNSEVLSQMALDVNSSMNAIRPALESMAANGG